MGKKKAYDYFEALHDLVKVSVKEGKYLARTISEFDQGISLLQVEEAHLLEQEGDEKKHEVMNHLLTEFITPLEREDIVGIAEKIDDVTDGIEDIILKMYMFHVTKLRGEAKEFAEIILRCNDALKAVMKEFHHFKKPAKLNQLMIEVHDLESQGDSLYLNAMRRLFENNQSTMDVLVWTEVFGKFEHCLDSMEHVADMVEMVIMKNS